MQIGQRIASARGGTSQEQLAKALHTSRAHISQIERNKVSPTLRTIEKIAAALRTTPVQLIGSEHAGRSAKLLSLLGRMSDDDIRCLERVAAGLVSLANHERISNAPVSKK